MGASSGAGRPWEPELGAGCRAGGGLREPAPAERVRNRAPLGRGLSGARGSLRTPPAAPIPSRSRAPRAAPSAPVRVGRRAGPEPRLGSPRAPGAPARP